MAYLFILLAMSFTEQTFFNLNEVQFSNSYIDGSCPSLSLITFLALKSAVLDPLFKKKKSGLTSKSHPQHCQVSPLIMENEQGMCPSPWKSTESASVCKPWSIIHDQHLQTDLRLLTTPDHSYLGSRESISCTFTLSPSCIRKHEVSPSWHRPWVPSCYWHGFTWDGQCALSGHWEF